MGKVTHHGWGNSLADIPQPTSVVMGRNLRRSSDETSKKRKQPTQKSEPKKQPPKE